MATNSNLHMSRTGKTDEFYTQLSTIEEELRHYRHHFKDKIVLCNCDDPYESNFFKYFALNFNVLGLKKLITTCYATLPIMYTQMSFFSEQEIAYTDKEGKKPYKIEITEVKDETGNDTIDLSDVEYLLKNGENVLSLLEGDGDFRSEECTALLHECDIVVTNPPFSLMKEYIPLVAELDKKFLVLGNMNHVTFKEIFHYFKDNKMWLGNNAGHFWFKVPEYYEVKKTDFKIDENGEKWRRLGNICWFTNLDNEKRHQPLELYKKYTPDKYPQYDTYDAIHVDYYNEIPCDTDKILGVPITYLAYHCDDQFEILGKFDGGSVSNELDLAKPVLNGKAKYKRIAIRKRNTNGE